MILFYTQFFLLKPCNWFRFILFDVVVLWCCCVIVVYAYNLLITFVCLSVETDAPNMSCLSFVFVHEYVRFSFEVCAECNFICLFVCLCVMHIQSYNAILFFAILRINPPHPPPMKLTEFAANCIGNAVSLPQSNCVALDWMRLYYRWWNVQESICSCCGGTVSNDEKSRENFNVIGIWTCLEVCSCIMHTIHFLIKVILGRYAW